MSYMLFDGPRIKPDMVIKGDRGKVLIFPTEQGAKNFANMIRLSPFTVAIAAYNEHGLIL